MASKQSKIQIAPDSTGKNLSTLQVRTDVADTNGVPVNTLVECQAIVPVNARGDIVDLREVIELLAANCLELKRIRAGLSLVLKMDLENIL